jgi:hypothetical protein
MTETATNTPPKCEMVRDWKVDEYGDAGEEIYCTNPARWIHEKAVLCCDECADAMRGEGFEVVSILEASQL